jgi:hypothetical protein
MNRKTIIAGIVLGCVLGALLPYAFRSGKALAEGDDSGMGFTDGKYRLFSGEYEIVIPTGNKIGVDGRTNAVSVFRIDTQTGKTWVYRNEQDRRGPQFYKWIPVSEN